MASGDEYIRKYFELIDDSQHGEIHVTTLMGKIISLKAKGSDTIATLKLKIESKAHILFNEQELMFNVKVLDNIDTLASLHIMKQQYGLILVRKVVESMQVNVNITFMGKTISLLVKPTDTISDVKLESHRKERINVDEQVLMFDKMVLGNKATLFDLQVQSKSTHMLMSKPRGFKGFMQIFIKNNRTGEIVTQNVKPPDTIRNIKAKIQFQVLEQIFVDEPEMIFNETVLHNDNTLADCNIKSKSTLTLMRISKGFMTIFIKTFDGKLITTLSNVKPSDTIYNVKSKIHLREEIPTQYKRLMFFGTELEDGPTLADYHIPNESTIFIF